MKRGLKTFARAIRGEKDDEAEEMLEKIVQGSMDVEVWKGYYRALRGMVRALDSENELTLPRRIADGKFAFEELEELRKEMEARYSREFIPNDEKGYGNAWSDVLQVITEDANIGVTNEHLPRADKK